MTRWLTVIVNDVVIFTAYVYFDGVFAASITAKT
jgi:hypothetical protein